MKQTKEQEELTKLRSFYKHWDHLQDYVGGSGNFVLPFTANELKEFHKLKVKYKYHTEFLLRF